MTPKQIFQSLSGEWSLKRTLGSYGIIHGTGIFCRSSCPSILSYREDFLVENFNQNFMHSYKEYEYHYKLGKIIKYFKFENKKNQIFYELEFIKDDFAIASHLCNLDRYDVEYRFGDLGYFSMEYTVKGPSKDYVIKTEFTKIK